MKCTKEFANSLIILLLLLAASSIILHHSVKCFVGIKRSIIPFKVLVVVLFSCIYKHSQSRVGTVINRERLSRYIRKQYTRIYICRILRILINFVRSDSQELSIKKGTARTDIIYFFIFTRILS